MAHEERLLTIRLMMERLISERESMRAMNEWRACRAEAQAYGEESFLANATEFAELIQCLKERQ